MGMDRTVYLGYGVQVESLNPEFWETDTFFVPYKFFKQYITCDDEGFSVRPLYDYFVYSEESKMLVYLICSSDDVNGYVVLPNINEEAQVALYLFGVVDKTLLNKEIRLMMIEHWS